MEARMTSSFIPLGRGWLHMVREDNLWALSVRKEACVDMLGIQRVSIVLHPPSSEQSSFPANHVVCVPASFFSKSCPQFISPKKVPDLRRPGTTAHSRPWLMDCVGWISVRPWDLWLWDQCEQVLVDFWRQSYERWAVGLLGSHASCHIGQCQSQRE